MTEPSTWWDVPIIHGMNLSPNALLRALLILLSAWVLSLLARRALELTAARRQIDPGVRYSLARLVHLAILTIALFATVGALGVDLRSMTVVAGALGLGIGFGLQSVAANFVAGLVLLFERPIRVGDRISLGTLNTGAVESINGYVQAIRLRATTVVTPDNIALIVPNLELVTRTVVNWSLGDARMRIRFTIGVAYDSDTDQVRRIMEEVALGHPRTLNEPLPEVRIVATEQNALVFQLLVWIPDPRQRGRVESELRWALVRRFRQAGVVIPFPQREVRVLSGELVASKDMPRSGAREDLRAPRDSQGPHEPHEPRDDPFGDS